MTELTGPYVKNIVVNGDQFTIIRSDGILSQYCLPTKTKIVGEDIKKVQILNASGTIVLATVATLT